MKFLEEEKKTRNHMILNNKEDIWGKNATATILRSLCTKSSSMCTRPGYEPGP